MLCQNRRFASEAGSAARTARLACRRPRAAPASHRHPAGWSRRLAGPGVQTCPLQCPSLLAAPAVADTPPQRWVPFFHGWCQQAGPGWAADLSQSTPVSNVRLQPGSQGLEAICSPGPAQAVNPFLVWSITPSRGQEFSGVCVRALADWNRHRDAMRRAHGIAGATERYFAARGGASSADKLKQEILNLAGKQLVRGLHPAAGMPHAEACKVAHPSAMCRPGRLSAPAVCARAAYQSWQTGASMRCRWWSSPSGRRLGQSSPDDLLCNLCQTLCT